MSKILTVLIAFRLVFDCTAVENLAHWMVVEKIDNYGDNLTLLCTLNETLQTPADTRRWYKDDLMCSFDNTPSSGFHNKFRPEVVPEGVRLTILNFSEDDINKTYRCEIGFNPSQKEMLLQDSVFRDMVISPKVYVPVVKSENDGNGSVIAIVVSIILIFSVVAAILVFLWKKGYIKRLLKRGHEDQDYFEGRPYENGNTPGNNQDPTLIKFVNETNQTAELVPLVGYGRNRANGPNVALDTEQNEESLILEENPPANDELDVGRGINENKVHEQNGGISIDADETSVLGYCGNKENSCTGALDSVEERDNNVSCEEAILLLAENIRPLNEAPSAGGNNDGRMPLPREPVVHLSTNMGSNQNQPHNSSQNTVHSTSLFKAKGSNVALAISGSGKDLWLSKEEQEEDKTDPKIPQGEPINRGMQYSLLDSQLSDRNRSSEQNSEEECVPSINTPIFKEYSGLPIREKSFDADLSFSRPTKLDIAKAGFFYTGHNDKAKCFFCGNLHDFKEGDDPFESHCHKLNCPHLKEKNTDDAK